MSLVRTIKHHCGVFIMSKSNSVSSAAIATAAALLFSAVSITTAVADEAKVHCDGVNSCKG
jgi:hypothetical protein